MIYSRLVILQLVLINLSLQISNEWKAWNNFELLNEYMGGLKFDPFLLESDKNLNNIAQFIAETKDKNLVHSYENISHDEVILTFGIKLNGSKTYKELLNTSLDSAVLSGFILYKFKNNQIKVEANQLKELMDLARCESCELFKSNKIFIFFNKKDKKIIFSYRSMETIKW